MNNSIVPKRTQSKKLLCSFLAVAASAVVGAAPPVDVIIDEPGDTVFLHCDEEVCSNMHKLKPETQFGRFACVEKLPCASPLFIMHILQAALSLRFRIFLPKGVHISMHKL